MSPAYKGIENKEILEAFHIPFVSQLYFSLTVLLMKGAVGKQTQIFQA